MTLGLNKTNNDLWISHFLGSFQTGWTSPKLVKSYAPEFTKKKAEAVQIYPDGDAMVLEVRYRSDDFPGIAFIVFARLDAGGIAEHCFEVRNESEEAFPNALYLMDAFFHAANRLVLPYDGNYYDLEERHASDYNDWDLDRISENWLFSRGDKLSYGFCWHPSAKLVKSEWNMGIEYELGRLAPSFGGVLPSLVFNGEEWLSSYR